MKTCEQRGHRAIAVMSLLERLTSGVREPGRRIRRFNRLCHSGNALQQMRDDLYSFQRMVATTRAIYSAANL